MPDVHKRVSKRSTGQAHTVTGSATDTRRAIDTVFTHLDSPAGEAPDRSYWLDRTHAHGQAGYRYPRLSEHAGRMAHSQT
jgi:hypothetical protein